MGSPARRLPQRLDCVSDALACHLRRLRDYRPFATSGDTPAPYAYRGLPASCFALPWRAAPEKTTAAQFARASEELFDRIMQLTDNAGATDEHRVLNYLSMRYPAIYAKAAEAFAHDFSLTAVEVRPSPLSSTRKLDDVIFCYTNRNTDFTEKFFVRVDVTEEFPFLTTKLSPYYDR